MLSSIEFSKLILSYGSFSHKKLQKLCYYVYSIYLTEYREKISDVYFEAWVHGPVSPKIYENYKNYGWHNIPSFTGSIEVSEALRDKVTEIISEYINMDANELEQLTHAESPWINARCGYSKWESSNEIISDDDIIEYYSLRN